MKNWREVISSPLFSTPSSSGIKSEFISLKSWAMPPEGGEARVVVDVV